MSQSNVARTVTRTERAPTGQSDMARTVTRTERAPTGQSDVARTVARTDGPIRRDAHRDAQRAHTDIESWDVARNERAQESCCFCEDENRNRREGIGNSKETDADNNL